MMVGPHVGPHMLTSWLCIILYTSQLRIYLIFRLNFLQEVQNFHSSSLIWCFKFFDVDDFHFQAIILFQGITVL